MLEYNFKHPSFGNLIIEGVYHKGKKGINKPKLENLRFKARPQIPTNSLTDNMMIYVDFASCSIAWTYYNSVVSATHIKNRSYNYYLISDVDIVVKTLFEDCLKSWIQTNPKVHVGGYCHMYISDIHNYKGVVFDKSGNKVV